MLSEYYLPYFFKNGYFDRYIRDVHEDNYRLRHCKIGRVWVYMTPPAPNSRNEKIPLDVLREHK